MGAGTSKQDTADFKRAAGALVTAQGSPLVEATRNWGMTPDLLRRWKPERARDNGGAFPGKGHHTPEQVERHR